MDNEKLINEFKRKYPHFDEIWDFRPEIGNVLLENAVLENDDRDKGEKITKITQAALLKLKRHGTRALNDFALKYPVQDVLIDGLTMEEVNDGKINETRDKEINDIPPYHELFALSNPETSFISIDKRDRETNSITFAGSKNDPDSREVETMWVLPELIDKTRPDVVHGEFGDPDMFSLYRPSRHLFRKTVVENWMDAGRKMDTDDTFTRLTVKQFVHLARDLDKPFLHQFLSESIEKSIATIVGNVDRYIETDLWIMESEGDVERTDNFNHVPLPLKLVELRKYSPPEKIAFK